MYKLLFFTFLILFVSVFAYAQSEESETAIKGETVSLSSEKMRNSTEFTNIIWAPNKEEHKEENRQFNAMATIAVTEKGRIYVSCETGGYCEPHPDQYIVLKYSDDGGKTWSEDLFHIETHKEKFIFVADPCLWIDPNGVLHLYWIQIDCRPDSRGKEFLSYLPATEEAPFGISLVDNWSWGYDLKGATWEIVCKNPNAEKPVFENPHYIFDRGMINKPLVHSSGRWIFSKYRIEDKISFAYSDDEGKTYHEFGGNSPKDITEVEPCLYEKSDGSVVCFWRTEESTKMSVSKDRGETWSPLEKTEFVNPYVKPACIKLPNGHIVFSCNDSKNVRENLTVYISADEGKTWKKRSVDKRFSPCYPDLEYRNGYIYMIYDYNRFTDREIIMCKFREEDFNNPDYEFELIKVFEPKVPHSPLGELIYNYEKHLKDIEDAANGENTKN